MSTILNLKLKLLLIITNLKFFKMIKNIVFNYDFNIKPKIVAIHISLDIILKYVLL